MLCNCALCYLPFITGLDDYLFPTNNIAAKLTSLQPSYCIVRQRVGQLFSSLNRGHKEQMYPTVNTVTTLRTRRSRNHGSVPGKGNERFSSPNRTSRPAMEQIQPFVQRVRRDSSSGVKRAGREFDHKPPSTRLRICGATPLLGHTPSYRAQGNILVHLHIRS
jgi:hypothetical protein